MKFLYDVSGGILKLIVISMSRTVKTLKETVSLKRIRKKPNLNLITLKSHRLKSY